METCGMRFKSKKEREAWHADEYLRTKALLDKGVRCRDLREFVATFALIVALHSVAEDTLCRAGYKNLGTPEGIDWLIKNHG